MLLLLSFFVMQTLYLTAVRHSNIRFHFSKLVLTSIEFLGKITVNDSYGFHFLIILTLKFELQFCLLNLFQFQF